MKLKNGRSLSTNLSAEDNHLIETFILMIAILEVCLVMKKNTIAMTHILSTLIVKVAMAPAPMALITVYLQMLK